MALDNICARPPATRVAWIHLIHAAGGASGLITMVVMFVVCLCCVFGPSLITCKKVQEHNLKAQVKRYVYCLTMVKGITFLTTLACTIPQGALFSLLSHVLKQILILYFLQIVWDGGF